MARTSKKTEGHEYQINKQVTLTCFDWGKNQSAKLTINEAFVIFGRIVAGSKKNTYFFSNPSYKDKDGEYHSLAYCFDKDIIEKINDAVTQFMTEDNE